MKPISPAKRWTVGVALALFLMYGWAKANAADCYVVAVGINDYLKDKKLTGCVNDARNAVNAFAGQKGKMFTHVYASTVLDSQATRAKIMQQFNNFARLGKPGDYFVLTLTGHGNRYSDTRGWYFCTYDSEPLSDKEILDAADAVIRQGKKVVIIVDSCYSGQLGNSAQSYLDRYRDANGGGLILMLSSSPDQISTELGGSSPFCTSVVESMAGKGDLNQDGKISLGEIRGYTYRRTYEILKNANNTNKQDSSVTWSPSFSANSPLALLHTAPTAPARPPISVASNKAIQRPEVQPGALPLVFTGNESLAGFGALTFEMFPGGRVVMTDAKGKSEGTWQQKGKQVTLRFAEGRVVYTGTMNDRNIIGTADNQTTGWSWSVHFSPPAQAVVSMNK